MRKVIVALLVLAAASLAAQERAVIKEISGKVEVKLPGKDWAPAAANQEIRKGDMLSTGFNSFLVLELGSSRIQMKPLSRMTLDELVKSEGTTKTAVNLRVGRVKVQVDKADGLKHDFTVKTPVSTAAVRGTEFDFDGVRLRVQSGLVAFANAQGQRRSVAGGESSSISGSGAPGAPADEALAETATEVSTSGSETPQNQGSDTPSLGGSVKVTIK
jgi:hypothetical protein